MLIPIPNLPVFLGTALVLLLTPGPAVLLYIVVARSGPLSAGCTSPWG
jgi:threonine/homoserine/homoserine lactone efflux protein